MRYARRMQHVLVVALAVGAASYYKGAATRDRDWVRVARDANYDIALDRASVTPIQVAWSGLWFKAFEVSYRTDHALPRPHRGKTFDREVVRAIVQCDSMLFQVLSVDMSVGDGRLVSRQRSGQDPWRQEWRRVERGTTEEMAALAACHFGRQATNEVADVGKK